MRAGKLLAAVVISLIASLLIAANAMAGIQLTVTTTADDTATTNNDGQCTLREAINASNSSTTVGTADCPSSGSPTHNQIGFSPTLGANPVIKLSAFGDLQPSSNDVTITGPATIDGSLDPGFRVLTSNQINLTLTSLTITNGDETATGFGGGIRANAGGSLTLNNSLVTGNKTSLTGPNLLVTGGGIFSGVPVTLNNSAVTNNQAVGTCTPCTGGSTVLGGGIEASGPATGVTLQNSVVSGNQAISSSDGAGGPEADGGGVRTDGDVLIEHSTVSGNALSATGTGAGAPRVQGAGMLFHGTLRTIDIELSTIANNLMKTAGTASASQQAGGGAEIFSTSTATFISDTIAGNGLDPTSQTTAVQGLNFQSSGVGVGSRTFKNTIIANPVGVGTNCFGDTPYLDASRPNDEFPVSMTHPCFDATHMNDMHADPQLGALGNNGGVTPTMLPAATSPVIDQGTAADQIDANVLNQDQRGLTRPVVFSGLGVPPLDGSDIGAVEVQRACAGQTNPATDFACSQGDQFLPQPPPTGTAGPTGQRAAALAKCKKKHGKRRKKCVKHANRLPV